MTALAFVLVAGLLALKAAAPAEARRVSPSDVRTLELQARLVQVADQVPPEVRDALAADPETALAELDRRVDEGAPWAHELRLVLSAVAVAFDRDEDAVAQLDALAESPEHVEAWRPSYESLYALARGEPAPHLDALTEQLRAMGASPWLTTMVTARHQANAGDLAAAEAQRAAARAESLSLIGRLTLLTFIVFGLGLLGLAVLLTWPLFLGQTVRARWGGGLADTASPFDTTSTYHVMVGWLLAFILAGLVTSLVIGLLQASAQTISMLIAVQTLLHGGIGLALIQRYGRRAGDTRPLSETLRLSARAAGGGRSGFVVWLVAGAGLALVVTFVASIINTGLFGEPNGSQDAVELFTEAGTPEARLFIGVAVVLFAPVFEEVIFRGFLYRNLRDRSGPMVAGLLSGVIFGFVHFEPHLILPLTALGAALAWLYEQSGSLLVPIAVHGLWNLGQLVLILILMG